MSDDATAEEPNDQRREQALASLATLIERREQLVADLATERVSLEEALERALTDPWVAPVYVLTVLEACPGWGKVSSRRMLDRLGVEHTAAIGTLDGPARRSLVEAQP